MATLQPQVSTGRRSSLIPDKGRRASNVQDNPPESMAIQSETGARQRRPRKKFILCFDGTGNKFSGTDSDSNILKIYRMLDRDDSSQFHYYQPGIGTYVATSSFSHTSAFERFKSWYGPDTALTLSKYLRSFFLGMSRQKIPLLERRSMSTLWAGIR
jgi:hypothetical protein